MSKYYVELHVETPGDDSDKTEAIRSNLHSAAESVPHDLLKIKVDRVKKVRRWPPFRLFPHLLLLSMLLGSLLDKKWGNAAFVGAACLLQFCLDLSTYLKNKNWEV